ncbi:MAG: glycosyltransferase [Anaerolineales bacterium]|nr:glycosyltransferase [Anaerolineales bacterium]
MNPRVSVLMSVYNAEQYLKEAIESILNQTFTDFEFIVIDDGSTDATARIIGAYPDNRIVFLVNQNNIGLTKSLNLGLEKARGEYIARMDADDISLPHRFDIQVSYLDAHRDVTVLGTAFSFIDNNGSRIGDYRFPSEHDLIAWALPFYNPIAHPTVMMRTAVIKALGAYDPDLKRSQDYDLWWRVSLSGKPANLEEVLVLLRQHQTQVSREYSVDQCKHGVDINVKHLSRKINQVVSSSTIEKMWSNNIGTVKDAVDVGDLIWKWYQTNISEVQSPATKLFITNDAFDKIARVIFPFIGNYRVWHLIIKLSFLVNCQGTQDLIRRTLHMISESRLWKKLSN